MMDFFFKNTFNEQPSVVGVHEESSKPTQLQSLYSFFSPPKQLARSDIKVIPSITITAYHLDHYKNLRPGREISFNLSGRDELLNPIVRDFKPSPVAEPEPTPEQMAKAEKKKKN